MKKGYVTPSAKLIELKMSENIAAESNKTDNTFGSDWAFDQTGDPGTCWTMVVTEVSPLSGIKKKSEFTEQLGANGGLKFTMMLQSYLMQTEGYSLDEALAFCDVCGANV